jgi:hypothetical protein
MKHFSWGRFLASRQLLAPTNLRNNATLTTVLIKNNALVKLWYYHEIVKHIMERRAAEPQPTRLVGAGLALPSFHTTDKRQGQGKPSPYETCKLFAK